MTVEAIRDMLTRGEVPNRTSQYPFAALTVGNYFTVTEQFQHARVAASEYGRRHGMVFSCRKQPDRTMRVYRVAADQARVDQRGRQGKRIIPVQAATMPSQSDFCGWLSMFKPGDSFALPSAYAPHFQLMQAWCELHSFRTGVAYRSALQSNGTLLVARSN